MNDRDRPPPQPHQIQVHPQQPPRYEGGIKSIAPDKGPSAGQILVIITLVPVCGALLGLAGVTLAGSLIGLAIATPVFVIFSPVLVPAALLIGGAVTAIITSGAFGLTGLASLSWVVNSFRQRAREGGLHVGEKAKQIGEAVKGRAQEYAGGDDAWT